MHILLKTHEADHPLNQLEVDDNWKFNLPTKAYRHFFKPLGFKELGAGSRGRVYVHDAFPDRVYKVGYKDGGGKHRDAWLSYAMASRKWPLRCVPVIYGIAIYQNLYVASLERLEEVRAQLSSDLWYALVEQIQRDEFEERITQLADEQTLFRDYSYLHNETSNIMMRPDTLDLVMTDPLYA